ncbi:hypothetical protein DWW05_21890 [Bacteroides thetaiotaomicron]|nr:hypothetical protein [Bacteroides thetaiotaomicron]MCE9245474.1 hypothetical protein [Bacteroides thetaiotaomicron]RGV64483.1 hypothetical protein DWW05_21890 [Bacteroides thetaiotaomicron]RHF10371.1 hypothetical protein DW697_21385 [Bacteroides thetaiotaomicron]
MMKFIYKSNLRHEQMPAWLKYITDITLEEINEFFPTGSAFEFDYLKWAIEDDLKSLPVKSEVSTELVTEEEQRVIFIKRSGRILVSIYFK